MMRRILLEIIFWPLDFLDERLEFVDDDEDFGPAPRWRKWLAQPRTRRGYWRFKIRCMERDIDALETQIAADRWARAGGFGLPEELARRNESRLAELRAALIQARSRRRPGPGDIENNLARADAMLADQAAEIRALERMITKEEAER